jgi:hypothetical protein
MWLIPEPLFVFKVATTGYNFAFAFSCLHTIVVNRVLLPKQLQPNIWVQVGLVLSSLYFVFLGTMGMLKLFNVV